MDDKRKEERKSLMAFTPVYSLQPKTLLGYMEDLTIHGAMIIGEKIVETGKQITILIEIPGGNAGGRIMVVFDSTRHW